MTSYDHWRLDCPPDLDSDTREPLEREGYETLEDYYEDRRIEAAERDER